MASTFVPFGCDETEGVEQPLGAILNYLSRARNTAKWARCPMRYRSAPVTHVNRPFADPPVFGETSETARFRELS